MEFISSSKLNKDVAGLTDDQSLNERADMLDIFQSFFNTKKITHRVSYKNTCYKYQGYIKSVFNSDSLYALRVWNSHSGDSVKCCCEIRNMIMVT